MCLLVAFASHNRQRAKNVLFIITYDPADEQQPIHWTFAGHHHHRPPPWCMVVRISLQSARSRDIIAFIYCKLMMDVCFPVLWLFSLHQQIFANVFQSNCNAEWGTRSAKVRWYLLFCCIVRRINLGDMWYCSGCSFRPNFFRYVVVVEASVRPISEN